MKQVIILILLIGLASFLAACGGEAANDLAEIGDPELGLELFQDRNFTKCESCHSLDGTEFRGAPTMLGISEQAGERVEGLSAYEYLRQSILDPSAYVGGDYEYKMGAYQLVEREEGDFKVPGTLTQKELDDLIAFLLTQ